MKCPHCNQEHPEDTKFCPETGEKIFIHIPHITSDGKKWSSMGDFEKGDIVVDGVVLGKTSLSELRRQGREIDTIDYETGQESKMFSFNIGDCGRSSGIIPRYTHIDLNGRESIYKNPLAYNKEAYLNLYNKVAGFALELWDDNPLLAVIGVEDKGNGGDDDDFVFDCNEIADSLEEHGYIRIENYLAKDTSDRMRFVHNEPNSNGDYVFITLDSEQEMIFFSVNDVSEWTSYRTGKVYRK